MFGLTRREQRWKAEQQAAELASCHSKCCRKCGNSTRNEALDQAAAIVERQDVDPAFKLRMASAIRSLKEELPNPEKL